MSSHVRSPSVGPLSVTVYSRSKPAHGSTRTIGTPNWMDETFIGRCVSTTLYAPRSALGMGIPAYGVASRVGTVPLLVSGVTRTWASAIREAPYEEHPKGPTSVISSPASSRFEATV
jgi:hypothetical protein